jgi:hypothetical protein
MGQQFPLALQVALYTASVAIVVFGAVLVHVLLRLAGQFDRVATAVERFEAEMTPLARESRAAVEVAGGLFLSPVLALNRTAHLLRTGATTFLRTLWTGRRPSQQKARTS